jgi:hypothetical protein
MHGGFLKLKIAMLGLVVGFIVWVAGASVKFTGAVLAAADRVNRIRAMLLWSVYTGENPNAS